VFGLSFGEVVLLCVIALVVIGPRNMPQAMRSLGKMVAKIRRMTVDLREQSGIDDILKNEGIEREVNELRKLASGRILDVDLYDDVEAPKRWDNPPRNREYPTGGVDSYGALPEDASPYLVAMKTQQEGRVARGAAFEEDETESAMPPAADQGAPIPKPDDERAKDPLFVEAKTEDAKSADVERGGTHG
jgi:sec-independent protein translocase protein TatB